MPADDLRRNPEGRKRLTHPGHELLRIAGIARCRGRNEPDPLDAELHTLRGVFAGLRHSAGHRLRSDDAGSVDAVAQAHNLHPTCEIGQRPRSRVNVSNQEPDRVRAAIDRADAGHGSPRGTQGPAAHQLPRASSASSPRGLTPGPTAREWPTSTCRHLTRRGIPPVSYTHLRAHETRHDLVCRLLLEKKKK